MNIKFKLSITIDLLLDGKLTLVYGFNGRDYQTSVWCCPNLASRSEPDFNRGYFPVAQLTELKFAADLPVGSIIDTTKSFIDLGFTGRRDEWVGPGLLFRYSLSRYIHEPIINILPKES